MVAKTLKQHVGKVWRIFGPGLTTGASDDDPSGVATYAQTGAQFGYSLLWLSVYSFPLMVVVQEMCARLGITTRQGLARNLTAFFPKPIVWMLVLSLLVANTINIAADISAMVASLQLLLPLPTIALAIAFTVLTLWLQIFTSYRSYSKYLKWLAMGLLLYVVTGFVVRIPVLEILKDTFIPRFSWNKDAIVLLCAILGTTISPYLFFWQASQEIEEMKEHHEGSGKRFRLFMKKGLGDMRLDVGFGMFLSNLIMFFIIAVTSATLHHSGVTSIQTAADAAAALRPLAGPYASLFFTLGIIGTGLLALPILAGSSAYAVCDLMGWGQGLNHKLFQSPQFYGVILVSLLLGLGISVVGIDPIHLLIFTAIINGIVSGPLVLVLTVLTNNKKLMGGQVNHPVITAIGIFVSFLMFVTGGLTIYFLLR